MPRALLLDDAPQELRDGCRAAGLAVVTAASEAEGRARLAADAFALVDGRLARPLPLGAEIERRVAAFLDRLGGGDGASLEHLYDAVMREVERPLLAAALSRARGVRAAAAAALGIDRGTLARRLRALGLDAPAADGTAAPGAPRTTRHTP